MIDSTLPDTQLIDMRGSYVAGRWVDSDEPVVVENPADESVVCEVMATPLAEVERAVAEARNAFDRGVWADRKPVDRARVLHAFLDHLETMHDAWVETMIAEAGQPRLFADMIQYGLGIKTARDTIDLYLSLPEEEPNPVPLDELVQGRVALSFRRYEPVGVVVAITPYNAAVTMGFQKLIPALMAGNSAVLRPSPLTPVSSLAFAAAAEAAELPAGVLSVVIEGGTEGAELLTSDPRVDMVSFTGSTTVGRAIAAQAAPTIKRVALELGGKSAQIYLPDALHRAVPGAVGVVMMTAGQVCVAPTRMLVPKESKSEILDAVSEAYAGLRVGPPSDSSAVLGPVISAAQRQRCERFVELAREHGGRVATGGGRPADLKKGYFFEPTILDLPDNSNPAAREEIFGPVLSVLAYDDVDDAVRIANDSSYGLSSQVFGADTAVATAVARRLRAGAALVNTNLFSAYAPGGGYKESGLGRERGIEGMRAFQEVKHLVVGQLPA